MSGSLMDILHIIHCIHCLVECCRCPPTILPTGEVGYNTTASRKTGYVQVICGVLSVGIGIAATVDVKTINYFVAIPIWSAFAFFIVAGILGITCAIKQTKRLIVGHLVMSILASLAAFQVMCFMLVAWRVDSDPQTNGYLFGCGSIVALIEFIVAIIAAVASYNGYYRQPEDYQIQANDDQGFNVPPQAFQGVPSMPAPGAPPTDLPPSYEYEGIGGEPMPRA